MQSYSFSEDYGIIQANFTQKNTAPLSSSNAVKPMFN